MFKQKSSYVTSMVNNNMYTVNTISPQETINSVHFLHRKITPLLWSIFSDYFLIYYILNNLIKSLDIIQKINAYVMHSENMLNVYFLRDILLFNFILKILHICYQKRDEKVTIKMTEYL